MTAAAPAHSFEEIVVDLAWRSSPSAPASLSKERTAARRQQLQRRRARDAAEEVELILRLAELSPDDDSPPPGTPGARRERWAPDAEFPGVSEFFPAELAVVLNCGRGTASFRMRRARVWVESLPATFAALGRGAIDERRAQELFDVLQHTDPALARRVEAAILPEATALSLGRLRRRAGELLLALDPGAAEENRRPPTAAQRLFVRTRDRTCRSPNRGQRVGWADHDHVIPHARGGETACTNLCCRCRSHHRLKTFARGWTCAMEPDGTLHVTTPSGVTRTTRPPGLHPPPQPPAEALPPPRPGDDPPPL